MFQKYKYVLAVFEEGSFTKAAKRLFISQPSLSVAIRNIESQIGAPLFERCGAGVKPTDAGYAYIEAAQKMQRAEVECKRQLAEINGLQTGKLTVGGSNYLTSDVLPRIISRFRALYPGIEIVLTEANSTHLRNMLTTEEVDLVIDNFQTPSDRFQCHFLRSEQILLCVPADREINNACKGLQILPEDIYEGSRHTDRIPPVSVDLFGNEPFIFLKSGNDMYDRAMKIFESSAIAPNAVFSVDQLNISYALTESGLGLCLMSDTFLKYRRHSSDVVLYRIDHPAATRPLHISYKKGRYCTKAMAEFMRLAQEFLRDSAPVSY